jgi:hypothetical protein
MKLLGGNWSKGDILALLGVIAAILAIPGMPRLFPWSSEPAQPAGTGAGPATTRIPDSAVTYTVKARIVAYGNVVHQTSQVFTSTNHTTDPNCDGNQSGIETYCFTDGSVKATSIGNFTEASGNCSRGVTPGAVGAPTQNCASANWRISGCGYDNFGIVKNCKGNGWITYHATVTGETATPAQPSVFEKSDTLKLEPGGSGSLPYQFPMDQVAAWRDSQLNMHVTIQRTRQGRDIGTIALNAQNPSDGGATLSFNPKTGQASVDLKNE